MVPMGPALPSDTRWQLPPGRAAIETHTATAVLLAVGKFLVKISLTLSSCKNFHSLEIEISDYVIQMVLSDLKSLNVEIETRFFFSVS